MNTVMQDLIEKQGKIIKDLQKRIAVLEGGSGPLSDFVDKNYLASALAGYPDRDSADMMCLAIEIEMDFGVRYDVSEDQVRDLIKEYGL